MLKQRQFHVVLHTDDGQQYGVTVPDLSGCFSGGDSVEHALECAKEAISLHIENITESGQRIPPTTPLANHQANPDFANGVWAMVEIECIET